MWLLLLLLSGRSPDEISVVVSRGAFKPAEVRARKGDTLRLVVTTTDAEHCFAVDAFRIEKRVVPGRATLVDLTPDRSGKFPFYCCLEPGKERGELVVSE